MNASRSISLPGLVNPTVLLGFLLLLVGIGSAQSQTTNDIIINEIVADNQSIIVDPDLPDYNPDYVELHNTTSSEIDLGMAKWKLGDTTNLFAFPTGTSIPANGFLVIYCDSETNLPGIHTGFGLDATEGEAARLFLDSTLTESNRFGIQVSDYAIGRVSNSAGVLQLMLPSPGESNGVAIALGNVFTLKINEWLATNSAGASKDWFEIYNPDSNAVSLSGLVFADRGSKDLVNPATLPSPFSIPLTNVAPLSFIGPFGFVRIYASDRDLKADEVRFSLSSSTVQQGGSGDEIWIFASDRVTPIDHISYGPGQLRNQSEGRLPDGGPYAGSDLVNFKLNSPSPGESNFNPLPEVVINEFIAHVDPPLEDAIELYNPTATNVNISGWWLSNNRDVPKKYQIPPNTFVAAGGYQVFYETPHFNNTNAAAEPFNLNSAHGGDLYLFKADAAGNLLGYRRGLDFPASENGVSFGRYINSETNADTVPMAGLSFGTAISRESSPGLINVFRTGKGAVNTYPKVGPVIISEVHYHPKDTVVGTTTNDNYLDEYIELRNITTQPVTLYDPNNYFYLGDNYADGRTNTWRIRGGVSFNFPQNITLEPNAYLLVVPFDPSNANELAAFKAKFTSPSIPASVQIVGPYKGKLSNGGASVELYKPDPPQGPPLHDDERGFVPYVFVERVKYNDAAPWPAAANSPDGTGKSLQRLVATDYANEPLNWKGADPTPGRPNSETATDAPIITANPVNKADFAGNTVSFTVAATGDSLSYRWQFQGMQIPGATNATLTLANLTTNMAGSYRAVVVNPVGITYSSTATLVVAVSDTVAPTVAISSPVSNARIKSTSPTITVTGTATDNLFVSGVEVQVNGGPFVAAAGTTSWSVDVTLVPGTNVVTARAMDLSTNYSAVASRTLVYVVGRRLYLTIIGSGTISGPDNNSVLDEGSTYRLTAKPGAGYIFSHWSGSVSQTEPVLDFVMQQDFAVVANFIPNPFTNHVAGTYNGLFHETDAVRPQSAGYLSLKVTTKGTYSGQLLLLGGKYPVKGKLSATGDGTAQIPRAGLSTLNLDFAVALDRSDTISGSLSDGTWTATLRGDRLTYGASAVAPQAGRYTFIFPGTEGTPDAPEGTSYGTLVISKTGQATFSGSLAENIKWSQKTAVSKNGEIPLYFAPYSGQGLFTGWLALTEEATSDLSGTVTWIKPSSAGGSLYPAGFTNEAQLVGSKYAAPASGQRFLDMTTGEVSFTGGNLPQPYVNAIILPPGPTLTTNSPHKLTLKFSPPTGLFSGTLTPTGTTTAIKFNGVVIQSATNAAGYFLNSNRTGQVLIQPAN